MKQVVILSSKGGTGKTSVTASLARLHGNCVTVDADVDAANLALVLPGEDANWTRFSAGRRATVDPKACAGCMRCVDACPYRALAATDSWAPRVDLLACEGCGICAQVCPAAAIRFLPHEAGAWTVRTTAWGPLVHAALGVGEDNSGKLVAEVRAEARRIALAGGHDLVLVDGPPGIGCPVHAAVTGTDLVVAVAEPGVAAAHDLVRLLELARWFRAPAILVLNKADLCPDGAADIRRLAGDHGICVAAEIPFLPEVPRALAQGRCLADIEALQPSLEGLLSAITAPAQER